MKTLIKEESQLLMNTFNEYVKTINENGQKHFKQNIMDYIVLNYIQK